MALLMLWLLGEFVCMLTCIFVCMSRLVCMAEMPVLRPLDDEAIQTMRPVMRGLLYQRYEAIWQACADRIAPGGDSSDARWVELAVRVADRLGDLFAVKAPLAEAPQDDPAAERSRTRAIVEQQLLELEARVNPGL